MPDYLLKEDGGYLLKEDGGKIILNGAFAPPPTGVTATKGTYTDKVVITWTKSTGATGYKVYRGAVLVDTLGDVATYDDTGADAPTITPGTASATDGDYSDKVVLSLAGESVANGTTHTYTVIAVNDEGESGPSESDTGYRGHGSLTYQWQRSAADSDANYSNLTGALTDPYNDTTGPGDGTGRYYRCVLNATGATEETSSSDRGIRAHKLKPRNISQVVVVNPDGEVLSFCPNAWGISPETRVNELDSLTFCLPTDSHAEPYLEYPNEVWLVKDGILKNEYKIFDVERILAGGAAYLKVTCKHYGYVLVKDKPILSYNKTIADGINTTGHLTAFLAYQETARVTLGGVSPFLEKIIAVNIASVTDIWEAFKLIRDTVGGYLYWEINPATPLVRKIWLLNDIGVNTGQEIRTGKNLFNINHKTSYDDFYNRLYATGSSVTLSGKTFTKVSMEKSSDATYGYLKLLEQYGAYKGWTGLGNALPTGMYIYKPGGTWNNPSSIVSAIGWAHPSYAIDNNESTIASYPKWTAYSWSSYLEVAITSTVSTQVKWYHNHYFSGGLPQSFLYEVDIYYGGAWHNIYTGAPGVDDGFTTTTFDQQTITGVRMRAYNMGMDAGEYCAVKEIYVWNTSGYIDETSKFVQGADEATVRCAIADYDASAPYVITYYHADYLIDLESVDGHDTLAAGWRSNIITGNEAFSATDVDALLSLGRIELTERKTPRVSIDINAIDLSVEEGLEFEELALGNTVKIIAEEINVAETQRIVGIIKPDLDHPGKVEIDIGNKTLDIIDEI